MDDDLFYKIIKDLSEIPLSHKFGITLARINEPLLDKRIQLFSRHIGDMLPNVNQIFWSNGSTLVAGKFEWMADFPGANLVISLNSVDEKKHMELMGFGLEKVTSNLDYLHKLKEHKTFNTNVILNAPYQSEVQSLEFVNFCRTKWPLFQPNLMPFFSWQGDVPAGENERTASHILDFIDTDVASLGCAQWFDIHILANGQITKCCIDEAGHQGDTHNVAKHNILALFNKSMNLRENLQPRSQLASCQQCTHLG